MATADQRSRSRKIRDLSREIDHRTHSIASSTGSNHGTITMDLTSVFNYSELDPNDDEIFSSTNKFQYTPAAKRPELRDTAKKYGRWSPRRDQTPIINTSIMDQAFKDFSGTAAGNSNTFTLELPRGTARNRFQASPTPVSGDDNSFLGTSVKKSVEQDKENTPRIKSHSVQKSLKAASTKGSPYISYASRNMNGERRTLAELHAQVTDGSENSLLLNDRPNTVTLPSHNGRFNKPQSTTSAPAPTEVPLPKASQSPRISSQSHKRKPYTSAVSESTQDQGRQLPSSVAHIPVQQQDHQFSAPTAQISVPKQRRQPSTSAAPIPVQLQEQLKRSSAAPIPVQLPHLTTTLAPGHSQVLKHSPTDILMQAPFRRRSQPESSFLFTPTYAPQLDSTITEYRTRGIRSNSNPTLPTQTFVIPAECAEKTKPIDTRVPVLVRDGKVEAPPVRRRRSPINGILIPDDEEELYRMILELHSTIGQLRSANEILVTQSHQSQREFAAQLDSMKAEIAELRSEKNQDGVSPADAQYEDDTRVSRASSRAYSRVSSRASSRVHTVEVEETTQHRDSEHFTRDATAQMENTRAASRASVHYAEERYHNEQPKDFTQDVNTRASSRASARLIQQPAHNGELEEELTKEAHTRVSEVQSIQASEDARQTRRAMRETTQNFTSAYLIEDIQATKEHPVLSSNARQVLDSLCEHKCNNCKICVRVASFHNNLESKGVKQTVRTGKPIPSSQRDLPYEDEPTLRPVRAPGIALASVIKGLEDEITHLKRRHAQVTRLYHSTDAAIKRKERMMICEEMHQLQTMIDVKSDQVYDLYDVLEGQLAAGQMMEESAVDITVLSAKEEDDDDTLPWEQVLDED